MNTTTTSNLKANTSRTEFWQLESMLKITEMKLQLALIQIDKKEEVIQELQSNVLK